ncbi:FAD dependent oxidoreductase [Lasallia pustulata]|uniref:FAD dependent oxidoreductase n=1 Tax=Lasallia pustulata TaxID=136370 RepID=A0A1W5D0N2_9LECA|nr:FAD dependent oxidoreductase [Lasallia pustulata]
MPPPSAPKHVVILGAGVIGLQTALCLLGSGYRVTMIAEFAPGDTDGEYASPWAGAHWRTHAERSAEEECAWDVETYRAWKAVVEREGEERARRVRGVGVYTSLQYWTHPHAEITPSPSALWWAPFVDRFAILPPTDLPPRTHAGVSFQTFALNVPLYLSSLLRSFLSFPSPMSRLVKARLPAPLPTALLHAQSHLLRHEPVHAWVNATGLGAGNLVPDRAVYPVRGQTVLVRGEAKAVRTRLGGREGGGGLAYVIPRPGSGTTVLGGTKGEGVWDTNPDDEATERILKGCGELAPELLDEEGGFEVLSVQVGLRPARKGGARVEVEEVVAEAKPELEMESEVDSGMGDGMGMGTEGEGETRQKRWTVVHCYGHAGAGYQNSVGSARKVVRLLEEYGKGVSQGAKH